MDLQTKPSLGKKKKKNKNQRLSTNFTSGPGPKGINSTFKGGPPMALVSPPVGPGLSDLIGFMVRITSHVHSLIRMI